MLDASRKEPLDGRHRPGTHAKMDQPCYEARIRHRRASDYSFIRNSRHKHMHMAVLIASELYLHLIVRSD